MEGSLLDTLLVELNLSQGSRVAGIVNFVVESEKYFLEELSVVEGELAEEGVELEG